MFKKVCAYIAYYKQCGQVCESKRVKLFKVFLKNSKIPSMPCPEFVVL